MKEMLMPKNANLHSAKAAKQDEFYTQREDIEAELRHYRQHFAGKTVYLNCDDPYESEVFKFFAAQFNALGLERLIATSHKGSPVAGEHLQGGHRAQDEFLVLADTGHGQLDRQADRLAAH